MNSVAALLSEAKLARLGERTALVCGAETVSYAELASRMRRSAAALHAFGVEPGERVLFLMRDTPTFAAAWLGAVYAGCVAIALNSRLSEADYRHILRDSGARLAVVEDVFVTARPDLATDLAAQRKLAVAGRAPSAVPSWDERVAAAAEAPPHEVVPESPALWLYSSGTTGHPKGIVHTHRSISCVGGSFAALGLVEGDHVSTTSRLFFAYGLEHGLLAPLAVGATSILCADWPDADAVIEMVQRHRPVALFSVSTLYRRLLAERPGRLGALRAVRRFVAGGERLSARLLEQWREATGGEVLNLYGMSETFCACVLTPPGTSNGERTGVPLEGVRVKLLDADGQESARGEPGVLWVQHPAQANAYANLPDKTREQFADGWFCSRDMFVRDAEGFLVHQGRSDELVKIAGQWVHPGEIEELAARAPGVTEAACLPLADADGLERLALFVTLQGGEQPVLRELAVACEALPRYKRPSWVRAVAELPRTATGKVQRYKLREMLTRELMGAG